MEEKKVRYLDSHNLDNLVLTKIKKNYLVHERKNNTLVPIIFKLENVYCPFGVEKYQFKEIVNFEFKDKSTNNTVLNSFSKIKQLDEFLCDRDEFLNKNYLSCLRQRSNYPWTIRTHIKQKKNLSTIVKDKNNNEHTILDIVCKKCNVYLELSSLWCTDSNYGIVLCINEIELLD